jgi:hypothetical protein
LHSFFSASSPFTIIGWFDDLPINDEHHLQNGIGDCLTIVKVVDDTFESEGRGLVDKRREDAPWDCIQSGRGDDIVEAAVLVLTPFPSVKRDAITDIRSAVRRFHRFLPVLVPGVSTKDVYQAMRWLGTQLAVSPTTAVGRLVVLSRTLLA